MTIDDLSEKIDKRFDRTDGKVDALQATVSAHAVTLSVHDREQKECKDRISTLEKIVWVTLGSGFAGGAAVAKYFL